jgi:hypothetical protein
MKTLLLAAIAIGLFANLACAQSLSDLKVGGNIADAVETMGMAPATKNQSGPFMMEKWSLPDANELSVTAIRATGRIVYIESDWGGKQAGTVSDFSGMVFGKTTFMDIRDLFGSSGFTFKKHFAMKVGDGSVAFFNCYQVNPDHSVVACFVTTITARQVKLLEAGQTPSSLVASLSVLDPIILADEHYLTQIWGGDIEETPHYRPVEWR